MLSSSPNRYAFVDAEMVVVQIIVGALSESQLARFEADYRVLFRAELSVPVYDDTPVYLGGSYDPQSGTFSPPPESESEPVIEEIVNGDAPVE